MPLELVFIRNDTSGAIATPSTGTSTPPPPLLLPRYYVPNDYGWVLVRGGDSHYIRVTVDFTTTEDVFTDLGASAPSASNYDTFNQDAEWTSPFEGFGWYDAVNKPLMRALSPAANFPSMAGGVSASKGVVFAATYGPILLNGEDLQRIKLGLDAQNQWTLTPI